MGRHLLGGFQFAPSPNFYLYVQAGTQNNFPTYIGALNWKIDSADRHHRQRQRPDTDAPAAADPENLQNPIGSPGPGGGTGPIRAPRTPHSRDIGQDSTVGILGDGLSIDNSVYRYRAYNADDLSHVRSGRTSTLPSSQRSGTGSTTSVFLSLNQHEKNYGIRASASRKLRRDLTATLGFTASKADEFNGNDRILEGDASLNYSASQTLGFYFNDSIVNRDPNALIGFDNGNLTDVRVTVGVRKSF